jgi:hypothetical protein
MEGRRVKILFVTAELVESQCFAHPPGYWVQCVRGLPEGAKCVGMGYDELRHRLWMQWEHESFPLTAPGDPYPWVDGNDTPQYRAMHGKQIVDDLAAGRVTPADLAREWGVEPPAPASLQPGVDYQWITPDADTPHVRE